MNNKNLGKLQEVDVRKIWHHEQYDFSEWLSSDENINLLGDTLALDLIDVETEKFVGAYRCDILCKDDGTGKIVLIENQLEQTNHDHLGKIITYASGLEASIVIWIVTSAREEHASAIRWLNEHTTEDMSFFLLEIHTYRIGESNPAPMFKIVEQPNGFSKQVKSIAKSSDVNESQSKRLEFWNKFNDYIDANNKPIRKRKATTNAWYNVSIGTSNCHISIDLVNRENRIRVGIWISDDKELYEKFFKEKSQIEDEIGIKLEWDRLDEKKASRIYTYIDGLDFNNTSNYNDLMKKTVEVVLLLKKTFSQYVR